MKVFIVFLGLLVVNVSFVAYHGDMGRYEKLQAFLKATAEECAAGASLYYDEETYGQGSFVINENEARKYIAYQIETAEDKLRESLAGKLDYDAVFTDQDVTVTVIFSGEDLFRLPFLSLKTAKRSAMYRWDDVDIKVIKYWGQ